MNYHHQRMTPAEIEAELRAALANQLLPCAPASRPPAQILSAYLTNLSWSIDCAGLKLNRLKRGTSAWKTQSGYLRGLIDAKAALDAEMGSALHSPNPAQNEP